MTATLFFDQANVDATARHLIATSTLPSISSATSQHVASLLQQEAHQVANSTPETDSVCATMHPCHGAWFVIDNVIKSGVPGYQVNYFVRLK